MSLEVYSSDHVVIRIPPIFDRMVVKTWNAISEVTSWSGWSELQRRNNRQAVMKAMTLGLLHLSWILFLSSGGWVLVWMFPKTRDYCFNLVFLISMFLITFFLTPPYMQGVLMGVAFWVAGLSFAPTKNVIIAFLIDVLFMHLHTNEVVRTTMLLFVFRNLWTTPRIWDLNPCSLIFGVIIFMGCTSLAIHLMFHYIPTPIVPFIIVPTFIFPDPFGDRITNIIISTSTATLPLLLLFLIGNMRQQLSELELAIST